MGIFVFVLLSPLAVTARGDFLYHSPSRCPTKG